jgi:hypothetical protein
MALAIPPAMAVAFPHEMAVASRPAVWLASYWSICLRYHLVAASEMLLTPYFWHALAARSEINS